MSPSIAPTFRKPVFYLRLLSSPPYLPGSTISGEIMLALYSPCPARSLSIALEGKVENSAQRTLGIEGFVFSFTENFLWKAASVDSSSQENRRVSWTPWTRSRTPDAERNANVEILMPGKHHYPFDVHVPETGYMEAPIPSSFEGHHTRIGYRIQAILVRGNGQKVMNFTSILVHGKIDASTPELSQPVFTSLAYPSKRFSFFRKCSACLLPTSPTYAEMEADEDARNITPPLSPLLPIVETNTMQIASTGKNVDVMLPKTGYLLGDTIPVAVRCWASEESNREYPIEVTAELKRKVGFKSPGFGEQERVVLLQHTKVINVLPFSSSADPFPEWTYLNFDIPPATSRGIRFSRSKISPSIRHNTLDVSYKIKLTFKRANHNGSLLNHGHSLQIDVPITIGTWSGRMAEELPSYHQLNGIVYDHQEQMEASLPPEYVESEGVACEVF